MDELERRLRNAFADDRVTLMPRSGSLSLIRAGVRRRRRNRAIATALTVAVVGGGGALAATQLPGSAPQRAPSVGQPTRPPGPAPKPTMPPATSDEVPWLDDPYNYTYPPQFPGAVADPSVPWCRAAQLALTSSWQGATGSWTGPLVVTNTSTSTCAVQGQPAVTMRSADGQALVSSTPEPFYVDAWVRLAPHAQASAVVVWRPEFCHEPVPATVVVDLPHSGGQLTTSMQGAPRCDTASAAQSAGHLDVDGFLPRPDAGPFTPLAALSSRIDRVPATVVSGGILDYRLQLQSPTAGVALNPCLPFRERLVATTGHVAAENDYRLNCDAAPPTLGTASSNRSTYFDLQLRLPGDVALGDYTLVWQSVLKPVAAVADSTVRVIAPPPPCPDGAVTAQAGRSGAATSHYGLEVVLRNVSSTACSLRGYPGVELLDAAGQPLRPAPQRGSSYIVQDKGPQTVVLDPGTTAWFQIGGDDYDNVHQQPCPESAAIGVYAPNTRRLLVVHVGFPDCSGVTFSAVAAGRIGA